MNNENQLPNTSTDIDILQSAFDNHDFPAVPILRYVPQRRKSPKRVLRVKTAWKGIESVLGDLINTFNVGRSRCLEFGVEFGYSTAALSCFFDEVIGVDTFTGDKHTVNQQDIFSETSSRL